MFSKKSIHLLEAMRIDSSQYYKALVAKFGCDVKYFVEVIEHFDDPSKVGGAEKFLDFCKPLTIDENSLLFDWLYEFYNNLSRYFEGGVFCLFKRRQAEWGAPQVAIKRSDVPLNSDVNALNKLQTVYRGLSLAEHHNKNYAQSWTIDLAQAQKFAQGTYSNELDGIVVTAKVDRNSILHFDSTDSEKETIIELGSILHAEQI